MKRIFLFIATNIAILAVLFIVLNLLGVESILDEQGVGLDYKALMIFSAVIGMGGSFISLAISKWTAKHMTGAKIIEQPRSEAEQWLVHTVQRHARSAGIGMPEVAIYDAPDMNAFATGMRRNNALVAVINTFVIFLSRVIGHVVDRAVFKVERGHGPAFWITAIIAQIILGILASVIVMWFSRRREFRADAGGARLAGRENMIAALERLKASVDRPHLPDQMEAFGISGNMGQGWKRLFMSHPPLDERIAALRGSL